MVFQMQQCYLGTIQWSSTHKSNLQCLLHFSSFLYTTFFSNMCIDVSLNQIKYSGLTDPYSQFLPSSFPMWAPETSPDVWLHLWPLQTWTEFWACYSRVTRVTYFCLLALKMFYSKRETGHAWDQGSYPDYTQQPLFAFEVKRICRYSSNINKVSNWGRTRPCWNTDASSKYI